MDIKDLISKKDKSKEYYWTLIIEPDWVQAGIWFIDENSAKIISASAPSAWKSDEELINTIDSSLSAASQELPDKAQEPSKTVFGISTKWAVNGQIKSENLEKIKNICTKLSLVPMGFVILSEAIAHLLKVREGTPLDGIVIGVGEENIEISLFKAGNVDELSLVARSVSPIEDVLEGITRFSTEGNLPSRIILFNGKESELEEFRQSLISFSWEKLEEKNFLHPPAIEIIKNDEKVLAVALAGGSEIADVSSVKMFSEKKSKEDLSDQPSQSEAESSPEDMGFVVGKDITKEKQGVEKKSVEDDRESSTKEKPEDTKHQIPQKQQENKDDLLTQEPQKREPPGSTEKSSPIDKILSPFTKLGNTLIGKFNFTKPKADTSGNILEETQTKKEKLIKTNPLVLKRIAIVGGFSFVLILILVFLFWFYFPKAIVSVYVSTKYIDDKIELSVNPNSTEVNFELREVQGKVYTKDISGDKTKSTSGSKTVGEKARGVVTLYRSGSEIDLEEGTIITGPGDLEFTLNEDTKVASGSAATPGTTDAAVTAADIGAQYNLALGETFAVANYLSSDIEAKNESDFSGGTSKQISSVSEEDRVSLEDELTKELEEKALELIKEDLDKEQLLVTDTVTSTIVDREFSDKVGDEASTLKLSMTIEVDVLVVDGPTLIAFSKEILKDKIPKGYVLKEDQIDFNFGEMSVDDGIYKLDLIIEANLLPEINIEEIRSHISGKSSDIAKNYLTTIQGFSRAEIDISFNLPGTAETLPRVKSRILIEVTRLEE